MSQLVQDLMSTPLGQVLTATEAQDLAQAAKARVIKTGQLLFKSGDPGNALYIVLSGSLDVVLGAPGSETVVAALGPGQVVGELEVMTSSLRVAALRATEETGLLELESSRFDEMLKQNRPGATKLVTTIARTLARRLAAVNQRLVNRPPPAPAPVAPPPAAAPKASPAPIPVPQPPGAAPAPAPKPTGGGFPQGPSIVPAAAPKPAAPSPAATVGQPIADDDLAVLDKLWS
jgi:CRP-like cAMP-binding protein